jgi:tetratricopeptide (TPR) repeat protein
MVSSFTGRWLTLVPLIGLVACSGVQRIPSTASSRISSQERIEPDGHLVPDAAVPAAPLSSPSTSDLARAQQVVRESPVDDAEALVLLAELEMDRGSLRPDADGWDDFERAYTALKRAVLAKADFVPALNLLALYHLHRAQLGQVALPASGGLKIPPARPVVLDERRPAFMRLEMARRICDRAIEVDPNYPPAHNSAGLIELAMRRTDVAIRQFRIASTMSSSYAEPLLNLGAVFLSIRDFENARTIYDRVLYLRPESYEANLGMALAQRGLIDPFNPDGQIDLAKAALSRCRALDPDRPEADLNEAILLQEYVGSRQDAIGVGARRRAAALLRAFLEKADGDPEYAEGVRIARERLSGLRSKRR